VISLVLPLLMLALEPNTNGTRLKELVSLEGVRDNQLIGYGLVVGLNGTGDHRQTLFPAQSLANLLQQMGVAVDPNAIRVANTAGVMVTATLPPFAQPGMHIDVTAAAIGDAATFARGRDLAAWLGLVPRRMTTGGKPRLLGISKRGNKYLRKLLVHGARAALPSLSASTTPLGKWLKSLLERAHKNTVVVALANKLARVVWAVLRHGGTYDAAAVSAA